MHAVEVADKLVENLSGGNHVRVLLAGPCGVGKTQVARELAGRGSHIKHIEHDILKQNDGAQAPCSVRCFDLYRCFSPHVLSSDAFVIDIGGGCVFRSGVDNEARLQQVISFKEDYSVLVVLLTAGRTVVKQRYLGFEGSVEKYFDRDWVDWENVEQPYWKRCSDLEVDTS